MAALPPEKIQRLAEALGTCADPAVASARDTASCGDLNDYDFDSKGISHVDIDSDEEDDEAGPSDNCIRFLASYYVSQTTNQVGKEKEKEKEQEKEEEEGEEGEEEEE